jgi:germination protein M
MRCLALLLVLLVAAACGGDGEAEPTAAQPPTPPAVSEPETTEAETDPAPTGTTSLVVYFRHAGRVQPVRRTVGETPALARAALDALFAGPTAGERARGLTSDVGTPTIARLLIADGVATVDLTPCPPLAQVVFTLTQFPTVDAVTGSCARGRRLTRAAFEDEAPAILVESPLADDTVESPLRIRGSANTFEATFQVDVVAASGRVVANTFVTATSGSGTRGTFDAAIPFEVDRPGGALVVYELSAEDGSRINEIEIPLRLLP